MQCAKMTAPNIVSIVGGLGNQLFQYLFGKALERQTARPTLYDTSAFNSYTLHKGPLLEETFELQLPRLEDHPEAARPIASRSYLGKRIISKAPALSKILFPRMRFDDGRTKWEMFNAADPAGYFFGTWQSQSYDDSFLREQTRRFTFADDLKAAAAAAETSLGSPSLDRAAIHIRLRDYLANPQAPHLPLDQAYYRSLMDILRAERGVREFFIFSDDIGWIRDRWFKDDPVVFVDGYAGQSGPSDLCYMARFKTIGISASTFGWWSAALSDDDAAVYFPSPWARPHVLHRPEHGVFAPTRWKPVSSLGHDLAGASDR
jgi:hypothetical protein